MAAAGLCERVEDGGSQNLHARDAVLGNNVGVWVCWWAHGVAHVHDAVRPHPQSYSNFPPLQKKHLTVLVHVRDRVLGNTRDW